MTHRLVVRRVVVVRGGMFGPAGRTFTAKAVQPGVLVVGVVIGVVFVRHCVLHVESLAYERTGRPIATLLP
jgi:hypothetical protein